VRLAGGAGPEVGEDLVDHRRLSDLSCIADINEKRGNPLMSA
jgi:hypothetical protein